MKPQPTPARRAQRIARIKDAAPRRRERAASIGRRLLPGRRGLMVLAVVVLGIGAGLLGGRQLRLSIVPPLAVTGNETPGAIRQAAADLRQVNGYGFTADQTTWTVPSGKSPGDVAARTFSARTVSIGATSPAGFWQVIYGLDQNASIASVKPSDMAFGVIISKEGQWRNEQNRGWFVNAGTPPGLGFDPVSAARLPDLLDHLASVTSVANDPTTGERGFHGIADAVDYPGVIASDGLAFTASPLDVTVWLDSSGRLASLDVITGNLNDSPGITLIEVHLTLDYTASLTLPQPSPLIPAPGPVVAPAATPSASPAVAP